MQCSLKRLPAALFAALLLTLVLLALPVLAGCPGAGSSGSGDTGSGYIEIRNAEDLARIGKDDSYPLDGDYRIPGGKAELRLSDWTPIGSDEAPFAGKFNGNGGRVAIESFSDAALQGRRLGLFGAALGAEFANLVVTASNLELTLDTDGPQSVAVLAALIREGTVKNVTALGSLRVAKTGSGSLDLGGVAAEVFAAVIEESGSAAAIRGTFKGDAYAGGIAARDTGRTEIRSSSALGDLSLEGPPSGSRAFVGGLVGYSEPLPAGAAGLKLIGVNYTGGTVSAQAYGAYSGGIAGYLKAGTVEGSFSSGTVNALGNTPLPGALSAPWPGGRPGTCTAPRRSSRFPIPAGPWPEASPAG
jgi:hypothetical protein